MSDHVELTDDEFATVPHLSQLDSYADARDIKKAVERLLAARVAALTAERDAYRDQSDEDQKARGRLVLQLDEVEAERDAARAELAAANTRCADARCVCGCTWDNHEDSGVRCTSHESCLGFRADLGEGWASYAAEQERNAALQARCAELESQRKAAIEAGDKARYEVTDLLDRVTALADEMDGDAGTGRDSHSIIIRAYAHAIRVALTPEGTE